MTRRPHSYDTPRPSSLDNVVRALVEGTEDTLSLRKEPQTIIATVYSSGSPYGKPLYPMECVGRIVQESDGLVEWLKSNKKSADIIVHENKLVLAAFKLKGAYGSEDTSAVLQKAWTQHPRLRRTARIGIAEIKSVTARGRHGKEVAYIMDEAGQASASQDFADLSAATNKEATCMLTKRIVIGACANSFEAAEFIEGATGLLPARVALSEACHVVIPRSGSNKV